MKIYIYICIYTYMYIGILIDVSIFETDKESMGILIYHKLHARGTIYKHYSWGSFYTFSLHLGCRFESLQVPIDEKVNTNASS